MSIRRIAGAGLVGLVIAASAGLGPRGPLLAREAEKPLALAAVPVSAALAELRPPKGGAITAAPALAERRVTLVVQPGSQGEAPEKLARLLDARLRPSGGADLHLEPLPRSSAAEARRRAVRDARARLLESLRLMRALEGGNAAAAARLAELIDRPFTSSRQSQVLPFLAEGDLAALARDGVWMSAPLAEFADAEARRRLASSWGPSGSLTRLELRLGPAVSGGVELEQFYEQLHQRPSGEPSPAGAARPDQRLVLQVYGEPDNPGVRGGRVSLLPVDHPAHGGQRPFRTLDYSLGTRRAERSHFGPHPPAFLALPPARLSHPALGRMVTLSDPARAGGPPPTFEAVLQRLAAATGKSVLADNYQSNRGDYLDWREPLVDVPLWRVLRQIEFDFWYDAEVLDGWIVLRHRRGAFEQERELPETVLAELDREVAEARGLSLERLQALARQLSPAQFQNLKMLYRELGNENLPYHSLRLVGSLTERQRRAAESPAGLPIASLSASQRRELRPMLAYNRPYLPAAAFGDLRFRIEETGPGRLMVGCSFHGGDAFGGMCRTFYPILGKPPHEVPVEPPHYPEVPLL